MLRDRGFQVWPGGSLAVDLVGAYSLGPQVLEKGKSDMMGGRRWAAGQLGSPYLHIFTLHEVVLTHYSRRNPPAAYVPRRWLLLLLLFEFTV